MITKLATEAAAKLATHNARVALDSRENPALQAVDPTAPIGKPAAAIAREYRGVLYNTLGFPLRGLYAYGYGGSPISNLDRIQAKSDAFVVDIRYETESNRPEFTSTALRSRYGMRYIPMPHLGNAHHQEPNPLPPVYPDLRRGLLQVYGLLLESNVILLCSCGVSGSCHRNAVAQASGLPHVEIGGNGGPKQHLLELQRLEYLQVADYFDLHGAYTGLLKSAQTKGELLTAWLDMVCDFELEAQAS